MSKWRDKFSEDYGTTSNVKRLNKEVKKAMDDAEIKRKIDEAISNEKRDKRLKEIFK